MATVTQSDRFERRSTDRAGALGQTTEVSAPAARRAYREREMGVGYGRSSGYASDRRYADLSSPRLMRCR